MGDRKIQVPNFGEVEVFPTSLKLPLDILFIILSVDKLGLANVNQTNAKYTKSLLILNVLIEVSRLLKYASLSLIVLWVRRKKNFPESQYLQMVIYLMCRMGILGIEAQHNFHSHYFTYFPGILKEKVKTPHCNTCKYFIVNE